MRIPYVAVAALLFWGCEDPAAAAREQQAQGRLAYETYCASCHEIDQGIGPRLKNEVLASRMDAGSLLQYTRRNMPYQAGNTLTPGQYLDITAYLVARGGFMDSTRVLLETDAASIRLAQ
ncbi:MAG: cytochrome c [Rhodothermales bacterium]